MIRRALVSLAVANYLLAVTVGGWFHDHGHTLCGPQQACSDSHHGPHASEVESGPIWDGQHVCSICRFLAQKPIPAQSITRIDSAPLEAELSTARPVRRAVSILSARQIRAPPCVA